tara:strand:+ start:27 stop:422 length:396 start_codon:yes stop_codon:yes gene_type:complete
LKIIPLLFVSLLITACAGQIDDSDRSQITPCPSFPPCDTASWSPSGSQADAWDAILSFVKAEPNMSIIKQTPDYLHIEATTPTVGFVDDVEIYRGGDGTIEARSASRIGLLDVGTNRSRLDRIEQAMGQSN